MATTDLPNRLLARNLPAVVIHEGRDEGSRACVQLPWQRAKLSSRALPLLDRIVYPVKPLQRFSPEA